MLWVSLDAAREKLGYKVAEFLEIKKFRTGCKEAPPKFKKKFMKWLVDEIARAAEFQQPNVREFYKKELVLKLDKIAEDFSWWSEDLGWEL